MAEQIKIKKIPVREQLISMQIKAVQQEQNIGDLQEIIKAQAGWIMQLENRIRKLEKK